MPQVSPLDMFWFIPVTGDGSYLGSDVGTRPADFHYLKQIAQAADRLGFGGALIPVGSHCEDPWITAAALAPHTERLRFLAALRPGLATPTHFARQAAALDRISDGRFLVNLVSGGDGKELAGEGIFLSHDERYAHAAEFLTIFRRLLDGETVDFDGRYQKVKGARLLFPRVQKHLPVWFGGSSDVAHDLAAAQTDVYLTWGEPPDQVKEKLDDVRARAQAKGRNVKSHRPRDGGGCLAGREQAHLQHFGRGDRGRAAQVRRGVRFRRPEAHERAARRRTSRQA